MQIELPVYVQSISREGKSPQYVASMLFFEGFVERHERLERALVELTVKVRQHLRGLGKCLDHAALVDHLYSPDLDSQRIDVRIELSKHTVRGKLLVVSLKALDRRLAFLPLMTDLWFEIPAQSSLPARVQDVLSRHFQRLERETGAEPLEAARKLFESRMDWITTIRVEFEASQQKPRTPPKFFSLFAETPEPDGDEELERVGRSLAELYPDALQRAQLRDSLVEELTHLANSADGRPVLLLGPRSVGKTAVLHEWAFRHIAGRRQSRTLDDGIWHLSPQRLISGMSYVGQWEARLLAILRTAKKRRHVLCFDDLLGLFQAGRSAHSDLTVIDVMKPYLERRDVRVIAESTPEAWRVLMERDRSLGDLFRVLPVNEPTESESLRIVLAVVRDLEGRHRCHFAVDAIPVVLDLTRRYVREAVMPGKAASLLRRLAVKYANKPIERQQVLDEFQSQSGLAMSFLDSNAKLSRGDVLQGLSRQVVGQSHSLHAAADSLVLSKARLNDPSRPLASLLFLGPTGVGKTQTAKALANFLFGDADRLIRFDMNEFVSYESVVGLLGTFHEPDGLLTGAVRRQPFSVVLFDEIEKAHPHVFDLLLQVLGEGRLTDAVGRTTDFTNTIVILTSNLGVRRSQVGLGFDPPQIDDAHNYTAAAEDFFRPEFFNRLDRVVPFTRLRKDEVRRIADQLLRDVLQRQGLRRRRCLLFIEPRAVDRIVELAYDPVLGARALRRGFERQVVQSVAQQLAAGLPDSPTIVRVYPAAEGVQVRLVPLLNVASLGPGPSTDLTLALDSVRDSLVKIESLCDRLRPSGGFVVGRISADQQHYLAIRERLDNVKRKRRQLEEAASAPKAKVRPPGSAGSHGLRVPNLVSRSNRDVLNDRNFASELASQQDLHAYFQELSASARGEVATASDAAIADLLLESALLRLLAEPADDDHQKQCVLLFEPAFAHDHEFAASLASATQEAFQGWAPVELVRVPEAESPHSRSVLQVAGPRAAYFADLAAGTHLFASSGMNFTAVRVRRLLLPRDANLRESLAAEFDSRKRWLEQVAAGEITPDDDPDRWPKILRIEDTKGHVLDLRTNTLNSAGLIQAIRRSAQTAVTAREFGATQPTS
jgi:ATP-dependent Clp protease ATP-binding subunit ClpC